MRQIRSVDSSKGNQYKGNLHCHSTDSDGALAPGDIVRMYRAKGYSFLAFTEHEVFSGPTESDAAHFCVLPGIERQVRIDGTPRLYHMNGIFGYGFSADRASSAMPASSSRRPLPHGLRLPHVAWNGPETAQAEIDHLAQADYLVTLNHPVWSRNNYEDVQALTGYFALEIYNHGCEVETRTGSAAPFWDYLLRSGRRVFGVATDDNHNRNIYKDANPEWDSFGGWVMVNAEELTPACIGSSLAAGEFYSSSGPEIYAFGVQGDEVYIECSPVEAVYFITFPGHGYSRRSRDGRVTRTTMPLDGRETYVRAECVDERGRTAWTNPIFLSP